MENQVENSASRLPENQTASQMNILVPHAGDYLVLDTGQLNNSILDWSVEQTGNLIFWFLPITAITAVTRKHMLLRKQWLNKTKSKQTLFLMSLVSASLLFQLKSCKLVSLQQYWELYLSHCNTNHWLEWNWWKKRRYSWWIIYWVQMCWLKVQYY